MSDALDRRTLTVVADYLGIYANDLQREIEWRELQRTSGSAMQTVCHFRTDGWAAGFCGRTSGAHFGRLPLCWQHHQAMVRNVHHWIDDWRSGHRATVVEIVDLVEVLDLALQGYAAAAEGDDEEGDDYLRGGKRRLSNALRRFVEADTADLLAAAWGSNEH